MRVLWATTMASLSPTIGLANPAFQEDEDEVGGTGCPAGLPLKERNAGTDHPPDAAAEDKQDGVVVADCALPFLPLKFLNRFRSPKWFLSFLCLAACLQGESGNRFTEF